MKYLLSFTSLLLFGSLFTCRLNAQNQNDTLYAYLSETPVIIDGSANDACWTNAEWHSIDQVWIPYDATIKASDFEGRFKLAWDSLYLYVLAEIIDDSISDDHVNPLENWWDDDCIEIFIDENRSKGNHLKNNNAFAYHVSTYYDAIDMNASGVGVNYKDNINVLMKKVTEHTYIWEVAIKNYNENFDMNNPEASRVLLHHNKLMGFSLAYCDNDETNARENFIGSMYMTSKTANDNYITADYFGSLLLVDPNVVETALETFNKNYAFNVFPNPVNDYLNIEMNAPEYGIRKLEVRDLTGRIVLCENYTPSLSKIFVGELKGGMYILNLISEEQIFTKSFVKMN